MKSQMDAVLKMDAVVDITDSTQDPEIKASGWRFVISRQAMDLCMTIPWTDASDEFRVSVMLGEVWYALNNRPAGYGEYLSAVGFAVNHTSLKRTEPHAYDRTERLRLSVFASIGPEGAPTAIVLSAKEAPMSDEQHGWPNQRIEQPSPRRKGKRSYQ